MRARRSSGQRDSHCHDVPVVEISHVAAQSSGANGASRQDPGCRVYSANVP